MPKASIPHFAMFTPAGNKAVAKLLDALAEQKKHDRDETSLLHWWRVRTALLWLEFPEVSDTAVREEMWPRLLALELPETFLSKSLAYEHPVEVLFGLQPMLYHQPGETLPEMYERQYASHRKQGREAAPLGSAE